MPDSVTLPRQERGRVIEGDNLTPMSSPVVRYNIVARILHWAIAVLIAGMFITDWLRGEAPRHSPQQDWWLAAHESLGLVVFIVSLARLGWRLTHQAPAISGSPLIRRFAEAGHVCLYLATLGPPIAGLARAMANGGNAVFFGFTVPSWTGSNKVLAAISGVVHGGFVMNLLLALIAGHVLAAFWHEFALKDRTLRRMI